MMSKFICICLTCIFFVSTSFANEQTYNGLVKRGIKRNDAQKYITSLFVALSEDSSVNSKKDLKYLVKPSQTPKGLNEHAIKYLRKAGFYRHFSKSLNSILKRLNNV